MISWTLSGQSLSWIHPPLRYLRLWVWILIGMSWLLSTAVCGMVLTFYAVDLAFLRHLGHQHGLHLVFSPGLPLGSYDDFKTVHFGFHHCFALVLLELVFILGSVCVLPLQPQFNSNLNYRSMDLSLWQRPNPRTSAQISWKHSSKPSYRRHHGVSLQLVELWRSSFARMDSIYSFCTALQYIYFDEYNPWISFTGSIWNIT